MRIRTNIQLSTRYLIICTMVGAAVIFVDPIFHQKVNAEDPQIGEQAPDFELLDSEKGSILTKQSFQGKPLFIFFTTTWCTPCQIGAENLAKYDDEKGGNAFNVLIVFVDEQETDNQFIEWRTKYGRNDWYTAKGVDTAQKYGVQFLDTKYVFDKNGIIKWIDIKPLEYSSIKPVLEPLL
jgi:thiol-disulfide isomerase/thioredoxin